MSRKRILYAEDDPANRLLLQIKLKQAGYDCDTAEDGTIALEMYNTNQYDLVILDQYMPGLDGEQVAAEIRRKTADLPLVAITSDDTLQEGLLKKGFNEVIIKPLRGESAIKILCRYLEPQSTGT